MIGIQASQAEDPGFWRELAPELGLESGAAAPRFDAGDSEQLFTLLKREGYVNVPSVLPESFVAPLRRCVATLHERRIPLAFAFVYDDFWQAFRGLSTILTTVLGKSYRALPDFWAWHVLAVDSAKGWEPHRDRIQPTLDPDNSPHTLTVWLPLTDATPLNGCIYALPAHLDDRFKLRRWDGDDNNHVKRPQDIRALPATSGSFLAWNQALLHWGSRASRLAAGPRTSIAFEFQRGDKDPFNQPLLDPAVIPSFSTRLGLIGKQVLQYEHMYPLAPEVAAIARKLKERYMPEAAKPAAVSAAAPSEIDWEEGSGGDGG